jgi:hypothetical protein
MIAPAKIAMFIVLLEYIETLWASMMKRHPHQHRDIGTDFRPEQMAGQIFVEGQQPEQHHHDVVITAKNRPFRKSPSVMLI